MTASQEAKLDKVHDVSLLIEGRLNLLDQKIQSHRELLLEHEQMHQSSEKKIGVLEKDKDKVLGALWVTGSSLFITAVAYVVSIFKS